MADQPLFMTQRTKVLEAYKAANQPFTASTKPYKSTVSFIFDSANFIEAASVGWLVARKGQSLDWFGYKINDPVPGNDSVYRVANEADTNLSKARTTNGAEDFVIEGMSISGRDIRVSVGSPEEITDADVANAVIGRCPIYDPASLYLPPQVMSPLNLENGLVRALLPMISIEFEWDRQRIVKMGTAEQIPEGGANSYLRASGEPSTNDRYRIPEGYIWRREGEPDSEFITRGVLQDPIAVPILLVNLPQTSTTVTLGLPRFVALDIVMRLHGLSVKLPSRN